MTADAVVGTGLIRHGGRKFSDYFIFNTDHKVIGIQYLVLSFTFFLIGGALGRADPHAVGHAQRRRLGRVRARNWSV